MLASPHALRLPQAVLRPVRGHHAFEACVEQLATAIRLGVYPRGSQLPAERELAEQLGVSPTARQGEEHRQCDSRLHLAIAAASGSLRLMAAVTQVQAELD